MGSVQDEKGLNGAGLTTVWNRISSLFVRKTDTDKILKDAGVITSEPASSVDGNEPFMPVSMYISGNKLVVENIPETKLVVSNSNTTD